MPESLIGISAARCLRELPQNGHFARIDYATAADTLIITVSLESPTGATGAGVPA